MHPAGLKFMQVYKKAARAAPNAKIRNILGGECTFPKFSGILEYALEWAEIGPTKILDVSAFEASNGAGKAGLKSGLTMSNRSLTDVGRQLLCTSARLQVRWRATELGNVWGVRAGQPCHNCVCTDRSDKPVHRPRACADAPGVCVCARRLLTTLQRGPWPSPGRTRVQPAPVAVSVSCTRSFRSGLQGPPGWFSAQYGISTERNSSSPATQGPGANLFRFSVHNLNSPISVRAV